MIYTRFLCLLVVCLFSADSFAEDESVDISIEKEVVTAERAHQAIEQLGASGVENEDVNLATGLYSQALEMFSREESAFRKVEEYQQVVEQGPSLSSQLKTNLATLKQPSGNTTGINDQWASLSIQELEQELSRRRVKITDVEEDQREVQNQMNLELNRPDQIRKEITDANSRLRELQDKIARSAATGGRKMITKADHFLKLAERQALEASLKKLQLEGVSTEIRKELLSLRESVVTEQYKRDKEQIDALQGFIDQRQRLEAEKTRESAETVRREAKKKHPLIKETAESNSSYGKQLAELSAKLESVNAEQSKTARSLVAVERNYERTIQQLAIATSSRNLSEVLNKQSEKLSQSFHSREFISNIDRDRRASGQIQLAQFRIDEKIQSFNAGEITADTLMANTDFDWQLLSTEERSQIRADLAQLLEDRKALIDKLYSGQTRLLKALADLSHIKKQLLEKSAQFSLLLNENLWWLPSNPAISLLWVAHLFDAVTGIRPGAIWAQASKTAHTVWRDSAWATTILFFLVAGLLILRHQLRLVLIRLSYQVKDITSDRYFLTIKALLITVLLAVPWALLVVGIEMLLSSAAQLNMETVIGRVLRSLGIYLFALGFVRYLFTEKGLAESHFNWDNSTISVLRKNLPWWIPLTTIGFVAIATTLLRWPGATDYRDTAGLIFFVASMLGLAVFSWRISRPWGKNKSDHNNPDSYRFYRTFAASVAVVFLSLTITPLVGFLYSSIFFAFLLVDLLLVSLAGYLAYNLAIRWLKIAEKKLAKQRMADKRELERKQRNIADAAEAEGKAVPLAIVDSDGEFDLRGINLQTVRVFRALTVVLVGFGISWVLRDFFPVYHLLDSVVLWQKSVGVATSEVLVPISLADGLMAVLVVALTVVTARNLPGLLEISILMPMKVDSGNRYAISSIVRYLIYGGGTITAAVYLGLGWEDIQWLVAAMGIGLGFGLKEIFANFISGLIILFERPVRPGDVVTIDGVSGSVSRIRIRATTLVDWDNRELIVPNQKLITESLINWTLSEQVTRVTFMVGIAYGSDVENAHRVMTEAVKQSPLVLAEPAPTVFFTGFGESSLDFQVRVFVQDLSNRMVLTHDLHMSLEKALRENGIEIPYPQRDLHLRSVSEGVKLPEVNS